MAIPFSAQLWASKDFNKSRPHWDLTTERWDIQQYIPSKPGKFGIKILCLVYIGKKTLPDCEEESSCSFWTRCDASCEAIPRCRQKHHNGQLVHFWSASWSSECCKDYTRRDIPSAARCINGEHDALKVIQCILKPLAINSYVHFGKKRIRQCSFYRRCIGKGFIMKERSQILYNATTRRSLVWTTSTIW